MDVTSQTTDIYDSNVTSNYTVTSDPWANYLPNGLYFHPHWRQYRHTIENIPDVVHYFVGLYIAFVGIFGTLGNAIVVYIFIKTKGLRTPPNMFIVNLALSDMGFSIINGFPLMTIASFQKVWMWGHETCVTYAFLGGVFGFVSINTLALVSIDRYVVIAMPFYAMKHVSHKRALMQLIVVWALAVFWSVPPFFGFGSYIPEGFQVSCSFDYLTRSTPNIIFNMMMFFGGFCTPVGVIACCYIGIIRAVSRQSGEMAKTAKKMGANTTKSEKETKQEIALAKMAAITISLFIISWLPYALVAQFGIWGVREYVTPYTCQLPVMFAKTSAMWNPILYALNHPKFRAGLDEHFPWLVVCKHRAMDKGDAGKSTDGEGGGEKKKVRAAADTTEDNSSMCSEMSESAVEVTDAVQSAPGGRVQSRSPGQGRPPPRPAQPRSAPQYNSRPNGNTGAATHSNPYYREEEAVPTITGSMSRAAGAAMHKLAEAYAGLRNIRDGGPAGAGGGMSFNNPAYMGDGGYGRHPMAMPMAVPVPTPVYIPAPGSGGAQAGFPQFGFPGFIAPGSAPAAPVATPGGTTDASTPPTVPASPAPPVSTTAAPDPTTQPDDTPPPPAEFTGSETTNTNNGNNTHLNRINSSGSAQNPTAQVQEPEKTQESGVAETTFTESSYAGEAAVSTESEKPKVNQAKNVAKAQSEVVAASVGATNEDESAEEVVRTDKSEIPATPGASNPEVIGHIGNAVTSTTSLSPPETGSDDGESTPEHSEPETDKYEVNKEPDVQTDPSEGDVGSSEKPELKKSYSIEYEDDCV